MSDMTPKEYFAAMPAAFRPDAAARLNATYQFELSGPGGGTWFVQIRDGALAVGEGAQPNPDVVLRAAAKDYVAIAEGRMSAVLALALRKFKISGSLPLAMKLEKLFKR
ncbi:MAG TPA: SCP2 sterol-binding domain-containing protein [Polyangia bacterium]|jgi:putative sterol carrier protein